MKDQQENIGSGTIDESPDSSIPVAGRPVKNTSWIRRYFTVPSVVGVAIIIYLCFFSEMSISRRVGYQKIIDSLEVCIRDQQDSLNYYRDLNRRLSTDPALLEQVVREQYNMKRVNEDVYVFK